VELRPLGLRLLDDARLEIVLAHGDYSTAPSISYKQVCALPGPSRLSGKQEE
jgi:hypothetical protein